MLECCYTTRRFHYSIGFAQSLKNATGSLPVYHCNQLLKAVEKIKPEKSSGLNGVQICLKII